ncbi:hypothetical protein BC830DRAFT_1163361 [Chytriomyces sp. MP71]|nr:hypothetical protein BC830DRAFT_1163361 [Chytriomyces sp. MP71]
MASSPVELGSPRSANANNGTISITSDPSSSSMTVEASSSGSMVAGVPSPSVLPSSSPRASPPLSTSLPVSALPPSPSPSPTVASSAPPSPVPTSVPTTSSPSASFVGPSLATSAQPVRTSTSPLPTIRSASISSPGSTLSPSPSPLNPVTVVILAKGAPVQSSSTSTTSTNHLTTTTTSTTDGSSSSVLLDSISVASMALPESPSAKSSFSSPSHLVPTITGTNINSNVLNTSNDSSSSSMPFGTVVAIALLVFGVVALSIYILRQWLLPASDQWKMRRSRITGRGLFDTLLNRGHASAPTNTRSSNSGGSMMSRGSGMLMASLGVRSNHATLHGTTAAGVGTLSTLPFLTETDFDGRSAPSSTATTLSRPTNTTSMPNPLQKGPLADPAVQSMAIVAAPTRSIDLERGMTGQGSSPPHAPLFAASSPQQQQQTPSTLRRAKTDKQLLEFISELAPAGALKLSASLSSIAVEKTHFGSLPRKVSGDSNIGTGSEFLAAGPFGFGAMLPGAVPPIAPSQSGVGGGPQLQSRSKLDTISESDSSY